MALGSKDRPCACPQGHACSFATFRMLAKYSAVAVSSVLSYHKGWCLQTFSLDTSGEDLLKAVIHTEPCAICLGLLKLKKIFTSGISD